MMNLRRRQFPEDIHYGRCINFLSATSIAFHLHGSRCFGALEKQLGTTADRSFGFGLLYLLLEPFTLLNDNCIVTGSPSFNTILQGRYTYPSSFGCCER